MLHVSTAVPPSTDGCPVPVRVAHQGVPVRVPGGYPANLPTVGTEGQASLAFLCPPPAPTRSLNELRVLLLEANRHSPGPERDLSREVHKAEWRIKEQKLKDDIRGLREKLTGLVCDHGMARG